MCKETENESHEAYIVISSVVNQLLTGKLLLLLSFGDATIHGEFSFRGGGVIGPISVIIVHFCARSF